MPAASPAPASEDEDWRERLLSGKDGPLSPGEAAAFAAFALARVSRTFALNIRVLPEPLRGQVLHAYLYCRMADTIEDDPALPAAQKSALLHVFAALFDPDLPPGIHAANSAALPPLLPAAWRASDDWEKILLARAPLVLAAFPGFPEKPRRAIADCVRAMSGGMADFALRQEAAARRGGFLIDSMEDLDRYCGFVAGTVGVMLCDLFIDHERIPESRAGRMRARRVSFGNGLQLVNILKDLADDRARGVSWLPGELLRAEGIAAADFALPRHGAGFQGAQRRVHAVLLAKTLRHLGEAMEYTLAIPRRCRRLRLFCLWPLLMAAETLALLSENPGGPAGGTRLKITRGRVARIVRLTGLLWWSDRWLRAEFEKSSRRVIFALK